MVEFSLKKKLHAAEGEMLLDVACQIETGQLVSLYGASGAGKTSILRMLAGFMQPAEGEITCNEDVWFNSEKKINVLPQKRNIGFVFQDYALFPNMNVRENLAFALQKGNSTKIIDELLETTGLAELQYKKIHTLSGGQKQRVALARALVRRPCLLLLDEPLSAVDNDMRERLQHTLLQMHRLYNLTTILVSHDIPEIVKLCDKTICINNGMINDYRPPAEIFFNTSAEKGDAIVGTVVDSMPDAAGFITSVLIGNQIIKIKSKNALQRGEQLTLQVTDFTTQTEMTGSCT